MFVWKRYTQKLNKRLLKHSAIFIYNYVENVVFNLC